MKRLSLLALAAALAWILTRKVPCPTCEGAGFFLEPLPDPDAMRSQCWACPSCQDGRYLGEVRTPGAGAPVEVPAEPLPGPAY